MDRRQWPSNHWGSPSSIGMTVSRHQSSCAGSSDEGAVVGLAVEHHGHDDGDPVIAEHHVLMAESGDRDGPPPTNGCWPRHPPGLRPAGRSSPCRIDPWCLLAVTPSIGKSAPPPRGGQGVRCRSHGGPERRPSAPRNVQRALQPLAGCHPRFMLTTLRRPVVLVPVVLLGIAVITAGLLAFQPWRLFTNVTVDEALPTLSSAPAASSSSDARGRSPSEPTTLATGEFISHEHGTAGSVRILELADGSRVLRIENLDTDNGPDLKVWLTDAPVIDGPSGWLVFDDGEYVDLGLPEGQQGQPELRDSRRRRPGGAHQRGDLVRPLLGLVRRCRAPPSLTVRRRARERGTSFANIRSGSTRSRTATKSSKRA